MSPADALALGVLFEDALRVRESLEQRQAVLIANSVGEMLFGGDKTIHAVMDDEDEDES
jgi:hypothetical protein